MRKIKILLFSIITFLLQNTLQAQFGVVSEYTYGGSGFDLAFDMKITTDGGYIMAGYSDSDDDDVTGALGDNDVWVAQTDDAGNLEWEANYGGTGKEVARVIIPSGDGGWVLVGYTASVDGDITDNSGFKDAWVLKIDDVGTLLWQNTFGGELDDVFNNVTATSDGGFLCVGNSNSLTGDLTSNYGGDDVWVVKINADGDMDWQKNYGGSNNDVANAVVEVADGYVFIAETGSNDIDVSGNHHDDLTPFTDFWAVKIETDGDIVWQKCYGGFSHESGRNIIETSDGDFIAIGSAQSSDGDVVGHYGAVNKTDGWVIQIDADGTLLDNQNYGGSFNDNLYSITEDLDGAYVIGGQSNSLDFDITGHHGGGSTADFWVIKINTDLSLDFSVSLGGSEDDVAQAVFPLDAENYIAAGYAKSTDGDVSDHHGVDPNHDFWLVNIGPCSLAITTDPVDVEVCEGQEVTVTVESSPSGALFEWIFVGGPTFTTGTNTLVIDEVTAAYDGDYYVIVSGA
ncbi:MAG: hypothetical protein H7X71_07550, partial [Chitinophagales bacterium]|nr:hypothetical protein [Chitinophagales bacterium]